jgi:hypothetical protein
MEMKNLPPLRVRMLVPLGLFLIAIPFLINNYIKIPDFFRGLMMGLGIGLDILGIVQLRRFKMSKGSF